MKLLEDIQTPSLILFATVFLLGVEWHDLERRRLVPASFDFGVNERQEHFVVVARNWWADSVELERLRVLDGAHGDRPVQPVQQGHRRPHSERLAAIFTSVFDSHGFWQNSLPSLKTLAISSLLLVESWAAMHASRSTSTSESGLAIPKTFSRVPVSSFSHSLSAIQDKTAQPHNRTVKGILGLTARE